MVKKVENFGGFVYVFLGLVLVSFLGIWILASGGFGDGGEGVVFLDEDLDVVFCSVDGCFDLFYDAFLDAKSEIKCAFYEFDLINLSEVLIEKANAGIEVFVLVDDNYLDEEGVLTMDGSGVFLFSDSQREGKYNNYMHDKFCVIDDGLVLVGSANPTERGLFFNDNNVLRFLSSDFAKSFGEEFDRMVFGGDFGASKEADFGDKIFEMVFGNESYLVSSYFCPQDDCGGRLVDVLESAKDEILFASFALTLDEVEDLLVAKSLEGVDVRGVVEKRNLNLKGSRVIDLNESFPIILDRNKYTMHHKFFVVDGKVVVTGSMNPTASGVRYNDESLIVIENERIAGQFRDEFFRLVGD